jgi:hypothetical protein
VRSVGRPTICAGSKSWRTKQAGLCGYQLSAAPNSYVGNAIDGVGVLGRQCSGFAWHEAVCAHPQGSSKWRAFFAPSSTANAILRQPIAARPVGCRSFLIGSCSSLLQQLKRAPLKIVGQGSAPAPSQREQSPSLALFVHVPATAVWWHVHVHASVVCCRYISRCPLAANILLLWV